LLAGQAAPSEQHWPSFRGAGARGVAEGYATPERWDLATGANIRWSTEVPGLAHSSPVIWGDRLFVTTAVGADEASLKVGLYGAGESVPDEGAQSFRLYCLDARTGAVLWHRVAHEGVPRIKRHPKSSHANSTPACNGRVVVTFFGSEGLYCHDLDGTLMWRKDLGVLNSGAPGHPDLQWGFASSPVIHDDLVIVQCDVQEGSFLAALDVANGETRWRTSRDEGPTWGTPTVDVRQGRAQIIVNGFRHIGGYDLRTGKELWKLEGGGDVPVPTPVVADDLVYVTNAHGRMAPIYAIKVDATGDLGRGDETDAVPWFKARLGNYMQTPLVYGPNLYCCRDNGVMACYDAKTGEQLYRERLGAGRSGFSASPVAADGKLYFSGEEGEIHVIRAGSDFEVIAVNDMGETCMATPAVSRGVLYFRTRSHVVAVGAGAKPDSSKN
jgi:outer membrane protein assembly factor BamB